MQRGVPGAGEARGQSGETEGKLCAACGTGATETDRFCARCGASLTPTPATAIERRVVTTLFCDLDGFTTLCGTSDPEDVDSFLRAYYGLARRIITLYGGVVEKFVGDAVVGVFGAAVAHEDDAERALRASARLAAGVPGLATPDRVPRQVRVGLDTGTVVVRRDADPDRGEGMLTGAAVVNASRLQAIAPPGGIVVGETTRVLAGQLGTFAPMAPIRLKGKSEVIRPWLLMSHSQDTAAGQPRRSPSPFVGREEELGVLTRLFEEAVASSTARFVLLVGEAGVGKSRLLAEFEQRLRAGDSGAQWLRGRNRGLDPASSRPLVQVVRQSAGIPDGAGEGEITTRLLQALGEVPDRAWIAARLGALLGLPSPPASREENFAAWGRFLELICRDRPTVLLVEDMHWASEVSREFTSYLISFLRDLPLLGIATARPELLAAQPELLALEPAAAATPATLLRLPPLSPPEVETLITGLGAHGWTEGTRRVIAERSAGNPLFAEELCQHLTDLQADGREPGLPTATPVALTALIAARLDALDALPRAVLADAAVIGPAFRPRAVAAVGGYDLGAVDAAVDILVLHGLVLRSFESTPTEESEFRFSHELIRDVAYQRLPRRARAERHTAAAQWLEALPKNGEADFVDLVVGHYRIARQLARELRDGAFLEALAAPFGRATARAARSTLPVDVVAAEKLFADAVALLPKDDPERPPLLADWADALVQIGKADMARGVYDEARRTLAAAGNERAAEVIAARSWYAHWLLVDGEDMGPGPEGVSPARLDPSPGALAICENLASRALHAGRSLQAIDHAEAALSIARQLGQPVHVAALSYRGYARCVRGEASGLTDLRKALRLARQKGGPEECAVASNLGECLALYEGSDAATAVHLEALELAGKRHDGLASCFCRCVLSVDDALAGRWPEVLRHADELDGLLLGGGDIWDLQVARANLAFVRIWSGDVAGAEEAAAWAEECSRSTALLPVRQACLVALATVRAAQGRGAEALALLEECERVAHRGYGIDAELRAAEAIRVAVGLGRPALAQALAGPLPASAPYCAATLALLDGLVLEHEGDFAAAADRLAAAEDVWERLAIAYEQAQALLARGRCLAAGGDPGGAREALTAARAHLAALRARPALAEAEALLTK